MAGNQQIQLSDEWQGRVDAMTDSAGKTFRTSAALLPNTTQVPNFVLDWIMALLTPEETKVLFYIIRRTLGFRRQWDEIAISQIANGIVKRNGERLDLGTGLSEGTILKAISYLADDLGIIVAEKVAGKTTYYRMNDGQDETRPLHLEAIASREAQIQERQKTYGIAAAERARDPKRRKPKDAADPFTAQNGQTPLPCKTLPFTAQNAPLYRVNTQNQVETKIETKDDDFVPPLELRTPPIGAGGLSVGRGDQVRKEQLARDRAVKREQTAAAKAALDALDGKVRAVLEAFMVGTANGGKPSPVLPQMIDKHGQAARDMLNAGYTPEQIGQAAKWFYEKWAGKYTLTLTNMAANMNQWANGNSGHSTLSLQSSLSLGLE